MQPQVFPPHPKLAPMLMHFMVLELDQCESHMCAALSPTFMLFVRGGVTRIEPESMVRHPRFTLRGPFMMPTRSMADPGTLMISVCFRPGMLQKGLGLSAEGLAMRFLMPPEFTSDQPRVERLLSELDQERPIAEYVRLFQEFLLATLELEYRRHIGEAFIGARQKMFFPIVELALHFGIGERQLERRVQKAFGVSLRDVRRITRFGLCLPRIIGQPVGWGDLTRIAQESGYYDQAHMHREFVELAGIGPVQLLQKIAGDDPAYWMYRMRREDFKNLFIPID